MSEDEALEPLDPELLPERELMSLISTGTPLAVPTADALAGAGVPPATPESDPLGGTASGPTGDATGLAGTTASDAAASGGGEETVTSENRDETITREDSAQAGP